MVIPLISWFILSEVAMSSSASKEVSYSTSRSQQTAVMTAVQGRGLSIYTVINGQYFNALINNSEQLIFLTIIVNFFLIDKG